MKFKVCAEYSDFFKNLTSQFFESMDMESTVNRNMGSQESTVNLIQIIQYRKIEDLNEEDKRTLIVNKKKIIDDSKYLDKFIIQEVKLEDRVHTFFNELENQAFEELIKNISCRSWFLW